MFMCVHTYIYIYIYVCVCVCVCACVYVCIYIYVCVCITHVYPPHCRHGNRDQECRVRRGAAAET